MLRIPCVTVLVLFWSVPVLAQPVLSLPDRVNLLDTTEVVPLSLDTDGELIDAYSFDVCHDDDVVSITEDDIELGADGAGEEFDTHILTVEDGGWAISAVLDGTTLGTGADSNVLELYLASYSLDAIGTSELAFCGDLEVSNVAIDGEDVAPELHAGEIEVAEVAFKRGDVDADGEVHGLLDGYRILMWGSGEADEPPCLEAADADGNGAVSAIPDGLRLLNWGANSSLDPPEPGPFECGALEDVKECLAGELCAGDGPTIVDPEDTAFTLRVSSGRGDVDDVAAVTISLEGEADVVGFQFGVCYDESGLTLEEAEWIGPGGALFSAVVFGDDGFALIRIWQNDGGQGPLQYDVSEGLDLYEVTFVVETEDEVPITICDTQGDPLLIPIQVVLDPELDGGTSLAIPETVAGSINGPVPKGSFLRGDIDGSGNVSALPDALFLLRWAFLDGADPPCEDAADVDDDETVSSFDDALTLLRWEFEEDDAPPDPGPDECGLDPDGDDLGCDVSPEACR